MTPWEVIANGFWAVWEMLGSISPALGLIGVMFFAISFYGIVQLLEEEDIKQRP